MSASERKAMAAKEEAAALFAALGDKTRLAILSSLTNEAGLSITELTAATELTRQAVRKHLGVLERARVVRCKTFRRERRYMLEPASLVRMKEYLEAVAVHWEGALARMKAMVERANEPMREIEEMLLNCGRGEEDRISVDGEYLLRKIWFE